MVATVGTPLDAQALFDLKWPATERQIRYRARQFRMSEHEAEDFRQSAALELWVVCRKAVADSHVQFEVRTEWPVSAALRPILLERDQWGAALSEAWHIPDNRGTIRVDGCTFTIADARMDAPEALHTATTGCTIAEAARTLGVSRQRIHQRLHELGAVRVNGRPILSRELVNAAARRRNRKLSPSLS